MTQNALVGTWKLVSFQATCPEGHITEPFGHDPVGYLMYTEDGYMSATIMKAHRPPYSTEDGTVSERLAALEGYLAYCGTYDFDGTKVVHHVKASLVPGSEGFDVTRFVELSEDILRLTTTPTRFDGKVQVGRLVWKRA
jgi:hypothetical protein